MHQMHQVHFFNTSFLSRMFQMHHFEANTVFILQEVIENHAQMHHGAFWVCQDIGVYPPIVVHPYVVLGTPLCLGSA